jgi:transcriptional regulator with XRE-family HTH domain
MQTPLRKRRQERGLTLEQVARQIPIDPSHYAKIEKGAAKTSADNARKIASFFKSLDPPEHVSEMEILYPEDFSSEVETTTEGQLESGWRCHR